MRFFYQYAISLTLQESKYHVTFKANTQSFNGFKLEFELTCVIQKLSWIQKTLFSDTKVFMKLNFAKLLELSDISK